MSMNEGKARFMSYSLTAKGRHPRKTLGILDSGFYSLLSLNSK